MKKEVFFVNLYRYGGGYIFGDNALRHKTPEEAIRASKDNLDLAGLCRIDIETDDKVTAIKTKFYNHKN